LLVEHFDYWGECPTLSSLKILLNLNEAVGSIGLSTHPSPRNPDTVDNVVNDDASDEARLGTSVLEVKVKVGDCLCLGEGVVGSQENRPETSARKIHRVDKGRLVSVNVDEEADSRVKFRQLVVPSPNGHFSDVDRRTGERGTSSQRTRRSTEFRSWGRVAEATVLVAVVRRGRRVKLPALLAEPTIALGRGTLIRMPIGLRVKFRCVRTISAVAETTTRGISAEHRLGPNAVLRGDCVARLALSRSRRSPLIEPALTWSSRVWTRRGRHNMRAKARWQIRGTTVLQGRRGTLRLESAAIDTSSLVRRVRAIRTQRHDRLLNSVLIRACLSDGLKSACHRVRTGVVHSPDGSARIDLILEVLDGGFKLLNAFVSFVRVT
jgi:hypothetical protein